MHTRKVYFPSSSTRRKLRTAPKRFSVSCWRDAFHIVVVTLSLNFILLSFTLTHSLSLFLSHRRDAIYLIDYFRTALNDRAMFAPGPTAHDTSALFSYSFFFFYVLCLPWLTHHLCDHRRIFNLIRSLRRLRWLAPFFPS